MSWGNNKCMVNEKSGLYNGEVKVRETPSLLAADRWSKNRTTTRLRDSWTVAMTMLTHRSFYHLNGDGHFLLQKSTKKYCTLFLAQK